MKYVPCFIKLVNDKKECTFPKSWDEPWDKTYPPNCSGILTGVDNNLYVIDTDISEAVKTIEGYGVQPNTKTRKGYHYYFKIPSGLVDYNNHSFKPKGLDLRCDGGLAFVGSYDTPSGVFTYERLSEEPQTMPDSLRDYLNELLYKPMIEQSHIEKSDNINTEPFIAELSAETSDRSSRDEKVLIKMVSSGMEKEESWAIVQRYSKFLERGREYFDLSWNNAVTWVANHNSVVEESEDPIMWDSYNGKLLYSRFGADVKFNTTDKRWYMWNGKIWECDNNKKVEKLAREVLDSIHDLASPHRRDSTEYKRLIRQSRYSASQRALESALEELKHKEGITHSESEFNADINYFNCINGTYELNTNTFREHRRNDLLTFTANVEYNETAKCPNWDAFLKRSMMDDNETIEYIKKFVGLSITGINTSHLVFCYGSTGGNGKSVFFRTLQEMMGKRYCQTTKADIIMSKDKSSDNNGPSPYIARLKDVRMLITDELPNERRIDERIMKRLTGGDMIIADKKHQDVVEFLPTWSMWMVGNFRPKISDGSPATYRRLKEIPWEYQTDPKERIESEEYIKQQFSNEYSGILNWAIEGLKAYHNNKSCLNFVPKKVEESTKDYIEEMDYVQHFIDDACRIVENEDCSINELYTTFITWCKTNHEYEGMGKISFSTRIKNKGFKRGQDSTGKVRIFKGISTNHRTI